MKLRAPQHFRTSIHPAACLGAVLLLATGTAAAQTAGGPALPPDLLHLLDGASPPPASAGLAGPRLTVEAARGDFAALVLALSAAPSPDAPLSARARGDGIVQRLRISLAGARIVESLDNIAEYRKTGLPVPPPMLLLEARLSMMGREYDRAVEALTEYLNQPESAKASGYAEALTLYDQAATAREIATTQLAEARLKKARAQCATPKAAPNRPGTVFRDCALAPEMVVLPGGDFAMGAPDDDPDAIPPEHPRHGVTVRSFAVARLEVTFEQWDACVAGGGCDAYLPQQRWGRGRQPIINVSWNDAQAYVAWLGKVTGKRYRLLSEAEWEYAARAGSTSRWPTGDGIQRSQANFLNPEGTVPVGSFAANAFGLHDMQGNVWEWTQDCWNPEYKGAPSDGSAWESGDCRVRVFRGGCWYNAAPALRSSFRFATRITARNVILGIRVARDLD